MQLQAKAPNVQKQDALNRLSCTLLVHGCVSSPLLHWHLFPFSFLSVTASIYSHQWVSHCNCRLMTLLILYDEIQGLWLQSNITHNIYRKHLQKSNIDKKKCTAIQCTHYVLDMPIIKSAGVNRLPEERNLNMLPLGCEESAETLSTLFLTLGGIRNPFSGQICPNNFLCNSGGQ